MEHTPPPRRGPRPLRDRTPRATSTGSSRSRRPSPASLMDVEEDRGAAPGLPAQAQQLRPRRRHRARRRDPAPALRAPRGARGRRHERQGPHLLLGREHLHARPLDPRLQGELLQVHERDAARPSRTRRAHSGAQVAGRAQRHRAPAAATSWRSPATRSCSSTTASSAVSLPEVPLLGVLPGTGGLTRLVDKRKVRRDLADVFSTLAEGVKGKRAVEWRLVDETVPLSQVRRRGSPERAKALAGQPRRPRKGPGVDADAARRRSTRADGVEHRYVTLAARRRERASRDLTVRAPEDGEPADARRRCASGAASSGRCAPSASSTTRSSTCASTTPRSASSCCRRAGDAARVLAADAALATRTKDDWFVREVRPPHEARAEAPRPDRAELLRAHRRRARASRARSSSSRSPPTAPTCSTTRRRSRDRAVRA